MKNLLFLDTETDGLRWERRIWDIGVVQYSDTGGRQEHSFLIKDIDLSNAETTAFSNGHFQRRHPLAGGTPEAGTELMLEKDAAHWLFKLAFGATISGVVVDFDVHALSMMMRRHNLFWPAWHHLKCVENLALGKLDGHALYTPEVREAHGAMLERAHRAPGRWVTDEIAAVYGITETPPEQRHTAIGDARLAEKIYRASIIDDVIPVPGVVWTPAA